MYTIIEVERPESGDHLVKRIRHKQSMWLASKNVVQCYILIYLLSELLINPSLL